MHSFFEVPHTTSHLHGCSSSITFSLQAPSQLLDTLLRYEFTLRVALPKSLLDDRHAIVTSVVELFFAGTHLRKFDVL